MWSRSSSIALTSTASASRSSFVSGDLRISFTAATTPVDLFTTRYTVAYWPLPSFSFFSHVSAKGRRMTTSSLPDARLSGDEGAMVRKCSGSAGAGDEEVQPMLDERCGTMLLTDLAVDAETQRLSSGERVRSRGTKCGAK